VFPILSIIGKKEVLFCEPIGRIWGGRGQTPHHTGISRVRFCEQKPAVLATNQDILKRVVRLSKNIINYNLKNVKRKFMRGIILSGGSATRLRPCTQVTSKQLLPVYNRPMIYYPLNTLLKAGIKEILIIVSPERAGDYLNLLGSGKEFGCKFTYEIQDHPRGLADAFIIGENFIDKENVCMILGDNIFEDDLNEDIKNFKSGGKVFAKKVPDPERFGVVKFDENMKAVKIEEKPKKFLSDYALTGLYIYDSRVIEAAKQVKPSERGELEITDLHNWYLEKGELEVAMVEGEWIDAGTFDSLLRAQNFAKEKMQGKMVI